MNVMKMADLYIRIQRFADTAKGMGEETRTQLRGFADEMKFLFEETEQEKSVFLHGESMSTMPCHVCNPEQCVIPRNKELGMDMGVGMQSISP